MMDHNSVRLSAQAVSGDYYAALTDNSLLKEVTTEFEWEREVLKEAKQVIGKERISGPLSRAAFKLLRSHRLTCLNLRRLVVPVCGSG